MHHGRQRVQIAPGPLNQFGVAIGILLDRGVVDFQHRRVFSVPVVDGMPRGTQVEQYRGADILQEDIVGRHITVQRLATVQHPQGAQHTPQHLAQPGFGWGRAHLGAGLLEGHAAVERHHHVGRIVRLPEAEYLDQ